MTDFFIEIGRASKYWRKETHAEPSAAAYWGNLEVVRLLLNRRGATHRISSTIEPPSHCAISVGNVAAMAILLDNGCDVK